MPHSNHKLTAYFTASIAAKEQYMKNYVHIIDYIKSQGHTIIGDHILSATESSVRQKEREERLQFHAQLERWIHQCDFMIAETSYPSISVGYEISLALRVSKPILILYSEGDPPSLFAHHKDEKIMCEKYALTSVKEIIQDFIQYISGKSDLRFTFFITPKIISYLDSISKKEKLPKSVYLRKLIEEDMQKKGF